MNLLNLILKLAQENKYFLLFIVYLIEGPLAGFISAIVASMGKLEIYTVFLLLISGEIGADIFYYYIGKGISESKLEKRVSKYENNKFFQFVKQIFKTHPVRTLVFIKTVGVIAVPSLILIGKYQSLKPRKFIFWTILICLVKDAIILFAGYTLGMSMEAFLVGYDIYRVIGILLSVSVIFFILLKVNQERIEEITLKMLKKI